MLRFPSASRALGLRPGDGIIRPDLTGARLPGFYIASGPIEPIETASGLGRPDEPATGRPADTAWRFFGPPIISVPIFSPGDMLDSTGCGFLPIF